MRSRIMVHNLRKSLRLSLVCGAALLAIASLPAMATAPEAIPAFPGAEGYGAVTRGGRGGQVIAVTNLNDSGPGSLREAVEAEGPRIVVFRVSGTIPLKDALTIRNPFITIAGQTAPGDGICVRDYPLNIGADDVIVRYIRVRLGDASGEDTDAISSRGQNNIILDHVSASWSIDETLSIYHCENVTVQWCLIAESLYQSNHAKGHHGFGGIWGGDHSTYHHNLLAHHSSRNPRLASAIGHTDVRNNVIYNWGYNSTYGGEKRQQGRDDLAPTVVNLVANYYKPGPATREGEVRHRITSPSSRDGASDFGQWYVAENVMDGNETVTADNWNGGVQLRDAEVFVPVMKLDAPWEAQPIRPQTAEAAYAEVLEHAGASLPKRDAVDRRIIEEVRSGTATYVGATYGADQDRHNPEQKSGIIDTPADVGGWPELASEPAPADTDNDGMPDDWESRFGLDPNDGSDSAHDRDEDGYTAIEEYLNNTDPTEYIDYTQPGNNVSSLL